MSARRLTARFEGRVQGVGFRFNTLHIASRHPVTGFVRNRYDGGVDLVVEGAEPDIHRFLDDLRAASIFRFVRSEHLAWSEALGEFTSFDIRHDG